MSLSTTQIEALSEKLSANHIKSRDQAGHKLSYIEGHHAIREANTIFGFDGWDLKTERLDLVQQETKGDKSYVGYTCLCIVTVGVTVRYGAGFGQGIDKDLGRAHESAIKEAETDAMKRALRTFGDRFGLALYDKEQTNVEREPPAPGPDPILQTIRRIVGDLGLTRSQYEEFKSTNPDWQNDLLLGHESGAKNYEELVSFALDRKMSLEGKELAAAVKEAFGA